MLRYVFAAAAALGVMLAGGMSARASVVITVDKTAQRLSVAVNGELRYEWPVSTARWGYRTPNGTYRPERLERQWYSRKYDMSPMPYSIFFDGGYAIHGSYEVSRIGRPASHGCIRLHPRNAAVLFSLVRAHVDDTRIVVRGVGAAEWREASHERGRRVRYEDPRRADYEAPRRAPRAVYERPHEERQVARQRWRGQETFENGFSDQPDDDAPPRYAPRYAPPREQRPW